MAYIDLHTTSGRLEPEEIDAAAQQLHAELADEQAARLAEQSAEQLRQQQWAAYLQRRRVDALEAARAAQTSSSRLHADERAAMRLLDGRPPSTGDRRNDPRTQRHQATQTLRGLRDQLDRIGWELSWATATRWRRHRHHTRIQQLHDDRARVETEQADWLQRERQLAARLAAIDAATERVQIWEATHYPALARGVAAHRELAIRADLTVTDP